MLFIIVTAVAFLNLNNLINSNKDFISTQIEQSFGRKITIGEINTGFKEGLGISLEDVSISDDKSFSKNAFIRARDIQINVEISPLLNKKLKINKLIVNEPIINIIKNKKGEYNFESLGSDKHSYKNKKAETSEKNNDFSLLASSIAIDDGQINYINKKNETELRIQNIDLQIEDLGTDREDQNSIVGRVSSLEASIGQYELQDLRTRFNLGGESLKIEDLSLRAYGGTVKANVGYGLGKNSNFTLVSTVRDLNLQSFLESLNPQDAKNIQGKANLDINVFGHGKNWEEIKTTLKGTSKAEIEDGAVLGINIADQVLKGITGISGLTFLISQETKDKYPQVFTEQDTEFEQVKSSFIIDKGKMETKDLIVLSKDYSITGKGWINLDGKSKLKSLLTLSKEFSKDLVADIADLKYISNSQNQVEIPFMLSGSLPKPKVKPDIAYLSGQLQKSGIRNIIDRLTSDPDDEQEKNDRTQTDDVPKKRLDEKILDEFKDLF